MGLSWALVFAPAPWGGHGIRGIAAGTVAGWAAGLATALVLLGRGGRAAEHVLRWTAAGLRWQRGVMARILRVGAPQSLEVAGMWLIHAFGIRVIARLPVEGALGAHILAIRVESMSFLPGFAVGTAAAALAGQYLGAGLPAQAVRAVRLCWKLAVALMGVIGILFVLGREQLIAWMAPGSGLHQQLAVPLVLICAFAQPAFATCIVMKTSMRGAGATGIVMRWAFGSMLFYRVCFLWWASGQPWMSLAWVWIVFSVDLTTQALIFSWLHFQGGWLKARV
jgi:Na+-driven multidrug efflux pump